MNSSKLNRFHRILAWLASWKFDILPERQDSVGDCCEKPKSEVMKEIRRRASSLINTGSYEISDGDFREPSILQKAAINYDSKLVEKLLRESDDVTTDLMQKDNQGFTAFYYVMKNCPASIEKLLFDCIQFGTIEKDYQIDITFDLLSPNDENIFFEEICKMKDDPLLKEGFDRVFLHPTTEAYFFERWSQIKYAYYAVPLFCHFIYCLLYSTYSILVYRELCGASIDPLATNITNGARKLDYSTNLEKTCRILGSENGKQVDNSENLGILVIVSWILLIALTVLMVIHEATKFLYYRSERNIRRYFKSLETVGYIWLIISVGAISFHQDPFETGEVVLKPYQYHVAATGVFTAWVVQMLLMRRIPKIGMFIEMIWPVSATFFQFFFGYGYLLAAFACSFYILFPDKYAFKNGFVAAFVKLIAMMLGEIDYNEMFYSHDELYDMTNYEYDKKIYSGKLKTVLKPSLFPYTAQIFVTIFILFVSIVVVNFLFGLAVYDVQKLYNTAEKDMLLGQIQIVRRNEQLIRKFGPNFLRKIFREKLVPCCHGKQFQEKHYIATLNRNSSNELERKIYDKCIRQKELNSSQAKKGWDALRHDISSDRMEKKLSQAVEQIRNDFDTRQQKMEEHIKLELASIKELLQQREDKKSDKPTTRIVPIMLEK